MPAGKVTLVYHGPQVDIVELGETVGWGDEIDVDEDVAGRLLAAHGFERKSAKSGNGKKDD